jgi:hypothetical protein
MFCSSCGKTISPDWKKCRHCGAPVGDSRFDGVPYTSAQVRIVPGQSAYRDVIEARQYTRTSYTGDLDAAGEGAVDQRTTYRPVYEGSSVPEHIRHDVRAAVGVEDAPSAAPGFLDAEPADIDPEELEKNIEGFDLSQIRSRPIVAKKPQGLSTDVREYVKRLESGEERPRRGRHLSADDPYAHAEEPAEGEAPEEEYVADEPQGLDTGRIIKIAVALVAVAALFVIGIYIAPKLINNFRREASVKIAGVTPAVYDQGVALLAAHVEPAYISDALAVYASGGYAALNTKLQADDQAIAALLPPEPGLNDSLFLQAVAAIQSDIGSAIAYDAIEIAAEGAATSEESAARWAAINQTVTEFQAITSDIGLTAVVNGERIDLVTPTPEPQASPTPAYPTLSKGDKSSAVQKMQERLYELGYLSGDRDGNFGSQTQTAVKLFQQDAGLPTTGTADPETIAAMLADDAPMTDNARITPTPAPTAEPTAEPTVEPAVDPI